MREILFRGKREYNGEWVQGYLTKMWGAFHIVDERNENLVPLIDFDTVGQYTGLTDKNGVMMWEGDIVKGLFYHARPVLAVVKFKDGAFGLEWDRGGAETFSAFTSICNVQYEKMGNIYDNKELLEVE